MTRNEAAAKVNEAFKAAKVAEKVSDPKAKGFAVEVEGHVASYTFKHGAHADVMRKDEVAKFRLAVVEDLLKKVPGPLQPGSLPKSEPEPEETEDVEEVEGE